MGFHRTVTAYAGCSFLFHFYLSNKSTCDGLKLGSRMGVGVYHLESFAPGVDLFLLYLNICPFIYPAISPTHPSPCQSPSLFHGY